MGHSWLLIQTYPKVEVDFLYGFGAAHEAFIDAAPGVASALVEDRAVGGVYLVGVRVDVCYVDHPGTGMFALRLYIHPPSVCQKVLMF